jgi:acyl carrier protein
MAEIQRILSSELEVTGAVSAKDRLADCQALDSLGLITLAVGLEDRFRIKLSEADAPNLERFADVIRLVNRRRGEAGR